MIEKIDVHGTDWVALQERRQELKNLSDLGNASEEEAIELISINTKFSILKQDWFAKRETSEGKRHPGNEVFSVQLNTSQELQACMEAGQPVALRRPPREAIYIDQSLLGNK